MPETIILHILLYTLDNAHHIALLCKPSKLSLKQGNYQIFRPCLFAGVFGWLPLVQHLQLALTLWLLIGGSDRIVEFAMTLWTDLVFAHEKVNQELQSAMGAGTGSEGAHVQTSSVQDPIHSQTPQRGGFHGMSSVSRIPAVPSTPGFGPNVQVRTLAILLFEFPLLLLGR